MIAANKILIFGISFGIISLITLLLFSLFNDSNKIVFNSILIGNFIAFVNFILGLLFVFWGTNQAEKKFLLSIYGGLLVRLIFLLILVVVILIFLEINEISFIFSILFFYFFYIVIEIIYLNLREK